MIKEYLKKFSKNYNKKSANYLDFSSFFHSNDDQVGVESYKTNPIIHRCVSLIATSASHIPWQVFKNNNNNRGELVKHHRVLDLLKNPSVEKSGADFFIESVSNLLLYGNSYILILPGNNSSAYALHNIHPTLVQQITSNDRLQGYEVGSGEKRQRFAVDNVTGKSPILHIKNYNPTNPRDGLSALSSAAKAINLHSKIMDWNKSLLKNGVRPSGALVFQDGNGYLSEEQFERLQKQFYENFSGSSNSGKPLILEGGLKWQETGSAEKFEKFIELKDSSARDIAIAFNVPPQLLGINGDNTYSNMQEARLALWEENIIPLLDKYADALSNWLSYWYKEDLHIDFNKEEISVLTERRESLWDKIAGADFMTINEKRALVGLPQIQGGNGLSLPGEEKE